MSVDPSTIKAPALEEIFRRQLRRPTYMQREPLAVDPQLWTEAEEELREVLRERGWPLRIDAETAKRGLRNFLLYGVPIIMDVA